MTVEQRIQRIKNIAFYLIAGIICVFFLFPIFWMIINSFHSEVDIQTYPPRFFAPLTLKNYSETITNTSFLLYLRNTVIYAFTATVIGILISAPGAYIIARIKRPIIGILILTSRMCPFILYLIPWYIVFIRFRLVNTLLGLVIVYNLITIPLTAWILIGFFRDISRDYEEAALMDGCSRYSAFLKIIFPLALPGIAVASILSFAECWNMFIIPLILGGPDANTLPVMISSLQKFLDPTVGIMFSTSVLTVMPVLIISILFHKHLTTTRSGGLKI